MLHVVFDNLLLLICHCSSFANIYAMSGSTSSIIFQVLQSLIGSSRSISTPKGIRRGCSIFCVTHAQWPCNETVVALYATATTTTTAAAAAAAAAATTAAVTKRGRVKFRRWRPVQLHVVLLLQLTNERFTLRTPMALINANTNVCGLCR